MSLGNGEHIQIHTDTIKLVFETGQLSNASPAALVHCVSEIVTSPLFSLSFLPLPMLLLYTVCFRVLYVLIHKFLVGELLPHHGLRREREMKQL